MIKKIFFPAILIFSLILSINAEDGYRLWLRYDKIANAELLSSYNNSLNGVLFEGDSPTIQAAKKELINGLSGLLGKEITEIESNSFDEDGIILAGTPSNSEIISSLNMEELESIGDEGYLIFTKTVEEKKTYIITANSDIGVLYGVFNFLRLLQTNKNIDELSIISSPKVKIRVLDHWDNLDGTIERGYSGFSILDWHKLPKYIKPQYIDYARADASLGINGAVLTNVNSKAIILTPPYLEKAAALADVFRPYGIKVYLTARFSAPIEIGGLDTADPLDPDVQNWWNEKVEEIYSYIPDFGGFLVKANSEGQPGPQDYNRSHADGANMLADALKPFNGIVMWRAFVYSFDVKEDRVKQAYNEFQPYDEQFRDNVLIQAKNGPLDFQPREPIHPLFGALHKTSVMPELQITQEYLGQGTSLVYLAPLYKELLNTDTYVEGEGSTVGKIVDGTLFHNKLIGMAGVSNVGTDRNWTGHTFGQANWYAFGRLAWDHTLTSEEIADEWIRMTFNNDEVTINTIKDIMMNSREIMVNYMTPLGLHHIMGWDNHYGPGPWVKDKHRADWTAVYYHRADSSGIGFDRTASGSNAVAQYSETLAKKYSSLETCPEKFLLWFHRVSWDYKTKSGRTLWDELCYRYYEGADSAKWMVKEWDSLKDDIDTERFERVKMLLDIQHDEAVWWRNSCVLYFQSFSGKPVPAGFEKPDHTLEYYENLFFPYAPGIKPQW